MTTTVVERRYLPLPAAEIRVEPRADDSARPVIRGYAAVFRSLSEDLGGFRELILPGAFSAALESCDCRALVDHDSSRIIGRTKSGTLRLHEDDHGLQVEIDPPDTQVARDLLESLRRGDLDQMSIGFLMGEDSWHDTPEGTVRELRQVKSLLDVSIVAYPAYKDTSVALRSLQDWRRSQPRRNVERARRILQLLG